MPSDKSHMPTDDKPRDYDYGDGKPERLVISLEHAEWFTHDGVEFKDGAFHLINCRKVPRPPPLELTDRAKTAIQYGKQEAERCQSPAVGTEYLLLGIIKEEGGIGAKILKLFGCDLRTVRYAIEHGTLPPLEMKPDRSFMTLNGFTPDEGDEPAIVEGKP